VNGGQPTRGWAEALSGKPLEPETAKPESQIENPKSKIGNTDMSLIVTGSIGIDSIESPTGTVENVLGGSAFYFAAAASFFGPVRLVGAVGEDFPDALLKTFRHFKVDLAGLEKRIGSKSFRWRGKYHQKMNIRETLDVQLNVLA
jgi:cytidine kinase